MGMAFDKGARSDLTFGGKQNKKKLFRLWFKGLTGFKTRTTTTCNYSQMLEELKEKCN